MYMRMILCHTCDLKSTIAIVLYVLLAFAARAEDGREVVVTAIAPYAVAVTEQGEALQLAGIHIPADMCPAASDCLAQATKIAGRESWRMVPAAKESNRHGRPLVWLLDAQGESLQAHILRQGLGWRYALAEELNTPQGLDAAEAQAEQQQAGVWGRQAHAVLADANAGEAIGHFRVVEGRVHRVEKRYDRYYINFAEDWRRDFTLIIDKPDWKHFSESWLASLEGKTLRARGWLFYMGGAAIAISHPSQLAVEEL